MHVLASAFKANECQNQFNNSFIILLKHFLLIYANFESILFLKNSNVEWCYCTLRQSVQPHFSLVQYSTGYTRCFREKVRKNLFSFRCKALLLSYPDDIIPTPAAIQRCVWYSTLSSERFGVHSITWCKETLRYFLGIQKAESMFCMLFFSNLSVDWLIHVLCFCSFQYVKGNPFYLGNQVFDEII